MNDRHPDVEARLSSRERPAGSPILYQSWGKLLFMHWRIPVDALRPLIPPRLTIDTYDGKAWVGLIPFTIWNLRPRFVPALPWISHFHEINVRTYVHLNGIPGIWFFSLDANRLFDVITARAFFHLPYYHATIQLEQVGSTIMYTTRRKGTADQASFDATWTIGTELPQMEPGSLTVFPAGAGRSFSPSVTVSTLPIKADFTVVVFFIRRGPYNTRLFQDVIQVC